MSGNGADGVSAETLRSISTPDRVESRLGTLEFRDGAPTQATAELLYDHLDFTHGIEAFINSFPGASLTAMREGFLSAGIEDNSVVLFSELMDSASLFLTANCDTVYFMTFLDLAGGPMVLDIPPLGPPTGILGTIDDMWFRWVTDFGVPGPDRAQGGRYLIVGPGYDGPLPDGDFYVSHARTTRVVAFGRAFMIDNDPKPAAEAVRSYPYQPGAQGTAVARFLTGEAAHFGAVQPVPETQFIEGSGRQFNTVPPNDYSCWETINTLVQQEPPGAGDPETMGLLASIGIVHGKRFEPDKRMRGVLQDAVTVGNATARAVSFAPRTDEQWAYHPGSQWFNMLFSGGYEFLDPPPQVTADGVVPAPSDGARKLNARIAFFYPYTGITPAMCMRVPGIGSQYLVTMRDGSGEFLDGDRSYRLTLPPGIPESRFWSVMLYDNQTRSMLQTGQPKPDIGSQSGTVETNPTAQQTSTSDPQRPTARPATGSRPPPAKASSPSCGSTTRCRRSSTRPGNPAKSSQPDS
jgi:hypothetical protein